MHRYKYQGKTVYDLLGCAYFSHSEARQEISNDPSLLKGFSQSLSKVLSWPG